MFLAKSARWQQPDVGLIPGHLMVSAASFEKFEGPQIHIYDLKALDNAWRPLPSSGRDITSQSAIYIETYPHAVLRLPTD